MKNDQIEYSLANTLYYELKPLILVLGGLYLLLGNTPREYAPSIGLLSLAIGCLVTYKRLDSRGYLKSR